MGGEGVKDKKAATGGAADAKKKWKGYSVWSTNKQNNLYPNSKNLEEELC